MIVNDNLAHPQHFYFVKQVMVFFYFERISTYGLRSWWYGVMMLIGLKFFGSQFSSLLRVEEWEFSTPNVLHLPFNQCGSHMRATCEKYLHGRGRFSSLNALIIACGKRAHISFMLFFFWTKPITPFVLGGFSLMELGPTISLVD